MSINKHKLIVSMIVKNEEILLRRALESVKNADEIVILDTGSTDKTIEIAREYTDKVFTDYKWKDSFCEARNLCLDRCPEGWILTIDADEYLEKNGIQKIRNAIKKTKADSLRLICETADGSQNHRAPRVHRNIPSIRWKGDIHNYLTVSNSENVEITVAYEKSPSHSADPERTLRILRKSLLKDPNLIREKYYLAREYSYRSEWEGVIFWSDEYLKKGTWAAEIVEVLLLKARALWQMRKGGEARKACILALAFNANHREAINFMGYISGPKNKERWFEFADGATNEEVLFEREQEQNAEYWERLYSKEYNTARYNNIYGFIGKWTIGKRILDIGCGTVQLKRFTSADYSGFDISKNALKQAPEGAKVWTGDAFWHSNYINNEGYDSYIMTEVLEHLENDLRIFELIPKGKEVIFSVPSFPDKSHVRLFTEKKARRRYGEIIRFVETKRFNMAAGIWKEDGPETNDYIILFKGTKK